jgi:hypothetical protein
MAHASLLQNEPNYVLSFHRNSVFIPTVVDTKARVTASLRQPGCWNLVKLPGHQAELMAAYFATVAQDVAAELEDNEIPDPDELTMAPIIANCLKSFATRDQS